MTLSSYLNLPKIVCFTMMEGLFYILWKNIMNLRLHFGLNYRYESINTFRISVYSVFVWFLNAMFSIKVANCSKVAAFLVFMILSLHLRLHQT